tara:strand:- start:77 stop:661 length:585 start_codon:yes stop_codon:yes gene_type:complete
MKKLYYLLPFIVFVFGATDEAAVDDSKQSKPVIPNVKFKDLDNKKFMLEDFYSSGPILMNFWTLSCEPCKKEMKHLSRINEKYKDSGFQVVSVNMDTPRTIRKVKQFVNSQQYSFKVLSDPRMDLFRKLGGSVMPLVVIINMDGTIEKRHIGYSPGDEIQLEEEIVEVILGNNLELPTLDKKEELDIKEIDKDE